ncbi:DMT family transporter [Sulfitobacter delicatus]|uniref:EamA-like transporter family protein n=1 Tax=Sulfitobacter delicatus TaxID=218672 RepID=A0A1G7XPF3_9RHOB|nr:DMT family transporter [Sulfitobacter delicatus]SDG86072.1 EamA-like transporter family protein [Sulfitobacter delicatus]
MTDNARGLLHIFINVLVWSFFPLFSVQSAGASPWAALFYSQIAGLAFALIFSKRKSPQTIVSDLRRAPLMLVVLSLASLFTAVFFFSSVARSSSLSATISLELWPFFALFFAALFIKKDWQDLSLRNYLLFALGGVGIIILVIADHNTLRFGGALWYSSGVLLAVLAAIASGATVVQTELYYRFEATPSFAGACYTIALVRAVGLPLSLGLALASGADLWSREAMLWGGALGVTAFGLASVMAISGLRYSSRSSHILLWYLTPIISVIWLMIFKGEELSDAHILALLPILFANIFSAIGTIRRASFFWISGATLLLGALIYTVPGAESEEYMGSLGITVGAFAILVSFVLQRKLHDVREMSICTSEGVLKAERAGVSAGRFLDLLDNRVFERAALATPQKALVAEALDTAAARIRVERITSFSSAENLVLGVLCVGVCFLAVSFRGAGLMFDVVSFVISFTCIFLTLFVYECSRFSFQWKIAIASASATHDRLLKDRDTVFLAVLGTLVLIAMVAVLLVDKWWVDFLRNDILRLFSAALGAEYPGCFEHPPC